MSKKGKPLPEPPSTPFGRKRSSGEHDSKQPLMADQMAMAMAEGKLDEFLQSNIPDSEYARKLAEMMMGMTGMMPGGGADSPVPGKQKAEEEQIHGIQPPDDVVDAVRSGDVRSVMEALAREHAKRAGTPLEDTVQQENSTQAAPADKPAIDKDVIDQLLGIASENGLSIDWLFFRALKRYVEEYRKTGNL